MRLSIVLAFFLGAALLPAQDQKIIKKVPVSPTSASSGKEMFQAYCAACHGLDGKGDGPAASAFKKAPRDLTKLAQDNGGKYPEAMVHATLKMSEGTVHGSKVMPVWGPVLSSASSSQAEVEQRITNLVRYIRTLQAK